VDVRHLVVLEDALAELEAAGAQGFDFDAAWRAVTPDDLATIIYTSGTTGPPKGAQWSHRTVMAAQRALDEALPMPSHGVVSFLPMAHTGGRITVHYLALAYGATITACPDIRELPAHLADARPDAFISTPGFWDRIRAGLLTMAAGEPDLRPYLARLGLDNLKAAFVGGAPCPPDLSEFFRAAGVPLLEAYGSTEVSLNIFNRVTDFRPGTAGKPLPGVEIRLLDDGELLCRSELNMVGYRGDPEQTAATIDADGWLHTGDIARIDADGYVSIVDRKKELIITSSGKNISPANVEAAVRA
jgi:long-subunit acyl-CoA synthetase (AMP-forming)